MTPCKKRARQVGARRTFILVEKRVDELIPLHVVAAAAVAPALGAGGLRGVGRAFAGVAARGVVVRRHVHLEELTVLGGLVVRAVAGAGAGAGGRLSGCCLFFPGRGRGPRGVGGQAGFYVFVP